MIAIEFEELITLREAADRLPGRRKGKRPHINTLYRWARKGCRGVVLETVGVGDTVCTSVEALQRFVERLSGHAHGPTLTEPRRVRTLQGSHETLRAAGIGGCGLV